MTLRPDNTRLLEELTPFVVATAESRGHFDLRPFGLQIPPDGIIDPLRREASTFLDLLSILDAATFGPEGMPMPRWVFYDAAELPGGIVGFGCSAGALSPRLAEIFNVGRDSASEGPFNVGRDSAFAGPFNVGRDSAFAGPFKVPPGYGGLVPLSMYIAIPTLSPGVWVGHNLASLREQLPGEALRGLGRLTKAVALKVFRASGQIGVTQWDSRALGVHTRMGPLRLLTAWTPAHTFPHSLTYQVDLDDAALLRLAGDPAAPAARLPAPELWIHSDDHPAMEALQARVEAGERLCVAGLPERLDEGRQRVPIARLA